MAHNFKKLHVFAELKAQLIIIEEIFSIRTGALLRELHSVQNMQYKFAEQLKS